MPNKEVLIRYAQIKMEMSKLEAELDLIKKDALHFISEVRGDSQQPVQLKEFPGFNFTVSSRKKWTYSPLTTEENKRLKKIMEDEEKTGDATFEDGEPYLVFKGPKDK